MAGEVVRIVNKGEKPFVDAWANQQYRVEPDGEAIVPIDAVNNWVGDGSTVDYGETRDRLSEYTRLRVKYGSYENDTMWDENSPKLEVYTLSGDRITTVIDDPTGEKVTPETQTRLENRLMGDRLAQLEQEIQNLRAAQSITDRQAKQQAGANVAGVDPEETDAAVTPNKRPALPFGSDHEADADVSNTDDSATISNATNDKIKGSSVVGEDSPNKPAVSAE